MQVPASRIFRVPNGVPDIGSEPLPAPGLFRSEFRLPEEPLILFLGRLHFIKGVDLLVEAFAALCRDAAAPRAQLVLAGPDDGQESQLRQTIDRLGIRDRVTFTGYLDQTRKLRALVDSALVVVPSRSEAFPITVVEALMCGRPVLLSSACRLDPMPDQRHGVSTFKAGSVADLKLELLNLLTSDGSLESAKRGRELVAREFSASTVADRLEQVYKAVSARNG
jgi:glycosyltransferase involved in cell wall biosynthesis